MNTILGFSRNAVALLAIVAAMLFVVLAGLLLLLAAAAGALVSGGGPLAVSPALLLIVAILLLIAIFVMLVLLLRCSCRSDRKAMQEPLALLTTLAPMLARLPEMLSVTATALHESGQALRWVHTNMSAAGAVFDTAANTVRDAAQLELPPIVQFENTPLFCIPVSFDKISTNPLSVLEGGLRSAGSNLRATTNVATIDAQLRSMGQVATDILAAAKLVGQFAKAIGGSPPDEVIQ